MRTASISREGADRGIQITLRALSDACEVAAVVLVRCVDRIDHLEGSGEHTMVVIAADFHDTQKLPIVSVELNAAQNAAVRTLFESALPTVMDAGSTPEFLARLVQNQPNPFNPRTTIRFDLANAGEVELTIYAVAGRRVRTLVQGTRASRRHEVVWSGVDDSGQRVASGVYLYRLRAGSYEETRRMTLLE